MHVNKHKNKANNHKAKSTNNRKSYRIRKTDWKNY